MRSRNRHPSGRTNGTNGVSRCRSSTAPILRCRYRYCRSSRHRRRADRGPIGSAMSRHRSDSRLAAVPDPGEYGQAAPGGTRPERSVADQGGRTRDYPTARPAMSRAIISRITSRLVSHGFAAASNSPGRSSISSTNVIYWYGSSQPWDQGIAESETSPYSGKGTGGNVRLRSLTCGTPCCRARTIAVAFQRRKPNTSGNDDVITRIDQAMADAGRSGKLTGPSGARVMHVAVEQGSHGAEVHLVADARQTEDGEQAPV